MNIYSNKNHCSGCTACMNYCINNAITMVEDSEGFKYPYINQNQCTNCNLCQNICPFHKDYTYNNDFDSPIVYAAKHKDNNIRIVSSSGGMFTALSDFNLKKKGVVYGAVFNDSLKVIHQKAKNTEQRDKMRGSKYVQSDLHYIFQDVKNELLKNQEVLFTGTPCQIAGLKSFLGNLQYDNLFLCDLVCHGVSSPLIWSEYIKLLELTIQSKVKLFKFRDKTNGWHSNRLFAQFSNNSVIFNTPIIDCFDKIFYLHVALRPSCHNCVFTNFKRPSDITIADFWGIESVDSNFDDNKGISLVLINTIKGQKIFNEISEFIDYRISNIAECAQHNLIMPSQASLDRTNFWNDYYKHGFKYVLKKFTDFST